MANSFFVIIFIVFSFKYFYFFLKEVGGSWVESSSAAHIYKFFLLLRLLQP
nr:MAG TPA: hypothetical protein [Caudoviricetes sp.]